SKNGVLHSALDGVGMGLGFTLALVVIAGIREVLGAGQFLGMNVMPSAYLKQPMLVAILAPGAFVTLGLLMALMNLVKNKK
ncbi:MAG TPA: Rnf-Nqr domain containing protein, partial [Candidatus Cloacimonadota bacterium]|nr:Rnf-Nqr domain containing protein [Candidatus Cloacimonadota bacterium]